MIALESNFHFGFKYRQKSGLETYFEDMKYNSCLEGAPHFW